MKHPELVEVNILATCIDKGDEHFMAFITTGTEAIGLPSVLLIGNMSEELVMASMSTVLDHWMSEKKDGKPLSKGIVRGLFGTKGMGPAPVYLSDLDILSPEMPEEIKELIVDAEDLLAPGEYYDETDPLPEVCQLIMPDNRNVLPWEDGYDTYYSYPIMPMTKQTAGKH